MRPLIESSSHIQPLSGPHASMHQSNDASLWPSALEMSNFSNLPPDQDFPLSSCLDHDVSNQYFDKSLPKPPSRFHYFRHSLLSLWYHRFKKLEGYHFGVLCCATITATVLIVNVIFTIWAVSTHKVQNSVGTLQEGNCKRATTLTFWTHLAINILSTLLLGASNYSMQCLSSPTRSEIDKAHGQGIWLDIGIPSLRNLRWLSKSRVVLWWLLAVSSIPLHLLYNGAVFSSLCTYSFTVFVVSSDFLQGAPFLALSYVNGNINDNKTWTPILREYQDNQSSLQRLENDRCLEIYTGPYTSANSDLILVTNSSENTNSLLLYEPNLLPSIITGHGSFLLNAEFIAKPQSWSLDNASVLLLTPKHQVNVQYCLSKPEKELCRLQFSLTIMIVVIICNAVKATCMGTIAWRQDTEPLVTLGDALVSFLDRYDATTKGHCMAGKDHFEKSRSWGRHPSRWKQNTVHWFDAASVKRWLVCNILYMSTLIAASVLSGIGLDNDQLASRSISHLWSLGFGNVSFETLVVLASRLNSSVIITILLANSPQILLSFLYFMYDGLFTCMLVAEEWSAYGSKRNFLRVTTPRGRQRSTYRLQLPYRYGLPLLIASSILHWLVSQSIFLARVNVIDPNGNEVPDAGISTCGYSPIAIIFVIILGSLVVLMGIANGFRKGRVGMPLAGSCSAAISAACHPPQADTNASMKRVMWGVMTDRNSGETGDSIGHCSFTSFDVEAPVVGKRYAGLSQR